MTNQEISARINEICASYKQDNDRQDLINNLVDLAMTIDRIPAFNRAQLNLIKGMHL